MLREPLEHRTAGAQALALQIVDGLDVAIAQQRVRRGRHVAHVDMVLRLEFSETFRALGGDEFRHRAGIGVTRDPAHAFEQVQRHAQFCQEVRMRELRGEVRGCHVTDIGQAVADARGHFREANQFQRKDLDLHLAVGCGLDTFGICINRLGNGRVRTHPHREIQRLGLGGPGHQHRAHNGCHNSFHGFLHFLLRRLRRVFSLSTTVCALRHCPDISPDVNHFRNLIQYRKWSLVHQCLTDIL